MEKTSVLWNWKVSDYDYLLDTLPYTFAFAFAHTEEDTQHIRIIDNKIHAWSNFFFVV